MCPTSPYMRTTFYYTCYVWNLRTLDKETTGKDGGEDNEIKSLSSHGFLHCLTPILALKVL